MSPTPSAAALTKYLKFSAIFVIYVSYVLFRRLPIVFLPQIRKEIRLTNDDIGLMVSCHAAAFTVSKLMFGMAADRLSNKKLFIGGGVICSMACLCLAFTSSFNQLTGIMLMIGGVQGAGWVPATKLIGQWFSADQYATMFSIFGCGSTLAGLILPIFKRFYWRTVEFNCGWMMLLFLGICHLMIKEEDQKDQKDQKLKLKKETGWKDIAGSSVLWNIALTYFFSMEMRTICETWIPLYITDQHNPSTTDGFQVMYEMGGIIGTLTSGLILDRLSKIYDPDAVRHTMGVTFSVMMMLSAVAILRVQEHVEVVGMTTGFFINGSINIWCLIGSQSGRAEIAGTCAAFISFIAASGAIFAGSPLAYLIASYGNQIMVALFGIQITVVLGLASIGTPLKMEKLQKTE